MDAVVKFLKGNKKIIYGVLLAFCLLPVVTPPVALFTGLIFALVCGQAHPKFIKNHQSIFCSFPL